MAVHGGPKIATSGLVLSVDGGNIKSFKGEATTNELLDIIWVGDGGGTGTLVTDNNLKYNGYPTYYYTPGTSLNSYLYGGDLDSSRTSTVWTFSCYVKRQDGAPITSLDVYMYYPNSDGYGAGTIQDVGNGWYRISRTRTGASSYISLCGFTGFASGVKYYLSGAQLEKKSYATTYVSTNTTRGTTVATGGGWTDLTGSGNNGELLNGVGENSNNLGVLVFDGVDDYVNCGSPSTLNFGTGNFNLSCWVNIPSTSGADWIGIISRYVSGVGFWIQLNPGNRYVGFGWDGSNFITSSTSAGGGQWKFISCQRTGSTSAEVYVNGISVASSSSMPSGTSNGQQIDIGRIDIAGRYSAGNIAQVSIYNRALTAQEIQQNYNATRGRYGV